MRTLSFTVLILASCSASLALHSPAELKRTAGGYYTVKPPAGESGPEDADARPVAPKVSARFAQLPQTNDWWSSLIWSYRGAKEANPYSEKMFPHPLSMQARASGLGVGYTTQPKIDAHGYFYPHQDELVVGVDGLRSPDTRVDSYGDWTVTAEWSDAQHRLHLTMGHGLPFVYATEVKGSARVQLVAPASEVWLNEGALAAVTVGGHDYALFAPEGASWRASENSLISDLAGKDFFSVALLPNKTPEALELFKSHAYAFVKGSKVSWRYDQQGAKVVSTFELQVEQKGPGAQEPLQALYRHQWRHTKAPLTPYAYVSPRGEMKLAAAARFETELAVQGLLPALPDRGDYDKGALASYLKLAANDELFKPGLEGTRDSYWEGKSFGKVAGLVRIADQLGEAATRDDLIAALKTELEDWFDGQPPRYYYRNETWKTLIGVPTMYHSAAQLNDHHFHYGYYVLAAATVAQYDPAWAAKWSEFVETLIRDAGNWRRDDPSYPFLRYFDPYAGHSWASGTTFFDAGNNEESSSEDMNFAAAVALWGEVTGHREVRDAGLFLYANVTEAIAQYWYDVDRAVYPKGFAHPAAGIVWGSGAAYGTWFSPLPEFIHGIQLTPMLTGSLWLGKYPSAIDGVLAHVERQKGAPPLLWRDMYWMLLALSQPDKPAAWFEDEHYFEPEFGNSMAYTYHFIHNLRAMGQVDASVTADTPLYAVFKKGSQRTYVAYNADARPITVRFSDGAKLTVPGRTLGAK